MFKKLVLIYFVLNFCFSCFTEGTHRSRTLSDGFVCNFAPNLTVGNRIRELNCCKLIESEQKQYWWSGSRYLSTYLETLETWNCSQFKDECEMQTFNFNNFTNLMYLRFCNPNEMIAKCSRKVEDVIFKQSGERPLLGWSEAVKRVDILKLTDKEILEPCLQIAMFDAAGVEQFDEVIEPIMPFCQFVWCGFDKRILETRHISGWTCMEQRCKSSIIIVMVVAGILAVATFVCNATIIAVFSNKNRLQNGQAVYRLSLAIADILVGIIVFPTFISTLQRYFLLPHIVGSRTHSVSGYELVNNTANLSHLVTVNITEPSGLFWTKFSKPYLNAVGFFTVLSLSVSIYTLVAACFDRFIALFQPLRYNKSIAFRGACIASAIIWILGLILSVLPFFVHNLRYGVVAAILVSSAGTHVLILYSIAFIIPLLIMWSLTIATFVVARRNTHLSTKSSGQENTFNFEYLLLKTLGIMVGVFTLCLLPSLIVLLLALFLENINFDEPTSLNQQSLTLFTSFEVVVVLLLASNSLWNCFIYSARDPTFRKESKEMYRRIALVMKLDLFKCAFIHCNQLPSPTNERQPISPNQNNSGDTTNSSLYTTRL